ncbi:hypothetical protein SNEBB_000681 [Seison nebaliae]|nr:hypothetical protein SNEBB_000681 [Seison nebaliae]
MSWSDACVFKWPLCERTLRAWLIIVSFMALGNTIQYMINGLQARTYGIWTLLASFVRLISGIYIREKGLYHVCFFSFILAFFHFFTETFYFQTANLDVAVLAPLMISSLTIIFMTIGYKNIRFVTDNHEHQH